MADDEDESGGLKERDPFRSLPVKSRTQLVAADDEGLFFSCHLLERTRICLLTHG